MMKEWILANVLAPSVKAMADLCEKNKISFVCHIELNEKGLPALDLLTYTVNDDATQQIKNTVKAAQGNLK